MRIAVLILVLMLVIAIATEVNACGGGRRRRGSGGGRRRSPNRRRCTTCSCCRRIRIGKRSVELGEKIYLDDDASLLGDKKLYDKFQSLKTAAVSKSREKRALKALTFPRDCNSSKLQNFARRCGLCIKPGGSHIKVCDGNRQLTVIPHHVKSNNTCRSIISILNARCI